jgi:hypothetical protein
MPPPVSESPARHLFNGRDLSGWEHVGPGGFSVEDGCLKTEGGMGLLWYTAEKLGDCVLRVVYRTSRYEDNSGVFIRIADRPPDPWFAVHHGYEVQICAGQDEWHRTGVIYSMTRTAEEPDLPPGQWNTLDIEMRGDLVGVTLNGVRLTDFDPSQPVPPRQKDYEPERGPRPAHGYIGLQNHDAGSVVYFREVSVAPLGAR